MEDFTRENEGFKKVAFMKYIPRFSETCVMYYTCRIYVVQ